MTILYRQHDCAVFGYGETRQEAISMAAQWLKNEAGKQGCSVDHAESLLVSSPKPGQLRLAGAFEQKLTVSTKSCYENFTKATAGSSVNEVGSICNRNWRS